MTMNSQRGSVRFYLLAISLALVFFALGIWEVLVERKGGNWLTQLILPVLLIAVLATMHSQARRDRIRRNEEEKAEEEAKEGAEQEKES